MNKIIYIMLVAFALTSCRSLSDNPYSIVGSWKFVDVDIDVKSQSAITDRAIRTAFAAYTAFGGGMDQLRGTIKFDSRGVCRTPAFTCDYAFYGNTLTLKQNLLNASGIDTKFTVSKQYDEMYLSYDAKEAISAFTSGIVNIDLKAVEKANIVLVFRRK